MIPKPLVLALLLPWTAAAQIQLVSGWDFGQFTFEGFATSDPVNFAFETGIPAGFSSAGLNNPTSTHNVDNTPVSAGTGTIDWSLSDAENQLVFAATGTRTVNDVMVDFAGSEMSNLNSDPNNLGLGFIDFSGHSFSLTTDLTGYGDYTPADYAGAANVSFAAASEGAVTINWFFDGDIVGVTTLTPGTLSTFNTYTLDLPSVFYGRESTLTAQVSGNAIFTLDNVQVNGVVVAPEAPVFTLDPQTQTVLAGATVVLTAEAGAPDSALLTYQWRKDGQDLVAGPTITGVNTPELTLTDVGLASAGAYTLRATNRTVFTTSAEAVLTVHIPPQITRSPSSASANPGQTVQFEAEASGFPEPAYQWRKGGDDLADDDRVSGATTAVLTLADVVEADSGEYTVVVTNPAGDDVSEVALLTVNDASVAPEITRQPASLTVVAGAQATFQVTANGAPAPAYQWLLDGVPLADGPGISGSTTRTLVLADVGPVRAGSYTVLVSNTADTRESDPATLTVHVPPSIPAGSDPVGQTALVGSEVVFSIAASGNPAPTYQWQKDGEDIPDATDATLVLSDLTLDDAGDYTVVLTNAAGFVESAAATLTVRSPARVTVQPVDREASVGARVTFSATATGFPVPTYQWMKDGDDIPGATSAVYTIASVKTGDIGEYSVRVSNVAGADTSSAARLVVAVKVAVHPKNVQSFAPGSSLLLQSDFLETSSTYQWFLNGRPIAGATASTYVITDADTADAGAYMVKIYDRNGRSYAKRKIAKIAITIANAYDALLRDPVTDDPVGRVEVKIADHGTFTGKLAADDGRRYGFRGKLTLDTTGARGEAVATIKRKSGLPSLELDLLLDAVAGMLDLGLGVAGEAEVLGVGVGEQRATSVDWNGQYTLSLTPVAPVPAGQPTDAFSLSAKISPRGDLRLAGRAADGAKISGSFPAGVNATYAVFVQPYKTGGHLAGELEVEGTDAPFSWFKPANAKDKTFPAGIDLDLTPLLTRTP